MLYSFAKKLNRAFFDVISLRIISRSMLSRYPSQYCTYLSHLIFVVTSNNYHAVASGGRDAGAQAAGARAQTARAAGAAGQQRRRRADFHSFIWRLINLLHLVRRLPIVSSLAGQAARDPCGGLGGGASGFSKRPFFPCDLGFCF